MLDRTQGDFGRELIESIIFKLIEENAAFVDARHSSNFHKAIHHKSGNCLLAKENNRYLVLIKDENNEVSRYSIDELINSIESNKEKFINAFNKGQVNQAYLNRLLNDKFNAVPIDVQDLLKDFTFEISIESTQNENEKVVHKIKIRPYGTNKEFAEVLTPNSFIIRPSTTDQGKMVVSYCERHGFENRIVHVKVSDNITLIDILNGLMKDPKFNPFTHHKYAQLTDKTPTPNRNSNQRNQGNQGPYNNLPEKSPYNNNASNPSNPYNNNASNPSSRYNNTGSNLSSPYNNTGSNLSSPYNNTGSNLSSPYNNTGSNPSNPYNNTGSNSSNPYRNVGTSDPNNQIGDDDLGSDELEIQDGNIPGASSEDGNVPNASNQYKNLPDAANQVNSQYNNLPDANTNTSPPREGRADINNNNNNSNTGPAKGHEKTNTESTKTEPEQNKTKNRVLTRKHGGIFNLQPRELNIEHGNEGNKPGNQGRKP